jgi:hypothetical protein
MKKRIFITTFILYCFLAYYLTISLQTYHNDAISRTALAFFVNSPIYYIFK